MGKKYLDTKKNTLEASILDVWKEAAKLNEYKTKLGEKKRVAGGDMRRTENKKLEEVESAAASFKAAIDTGGAPYFAYRLYGDLLIEMGHKHEALQLLQSHYETLPDDLLEAMKPVVGDRIRLLKRELNIPN